VILLLVTIVLSYGVTRWTNRSDRRRQPDEVSSAWRTAVNTVVGVAVLYTLLPALWLVAGRYENRDALFPERLCFL